MFGQANVTLLVVAILAFANVYCAPKGQGNGNKPNILLVFADDLSRQIDHLNIAPYAIPTPNIDALAKKGVSFSNAHACVPACNPSRTCFLYGTSPLDNNVLYNADDAANPALSSKEHLVAYLVRQGYYAVRAQRIFHIDTEIDQMFDVGKFFGNSGAYAEGEELTDKRLKGSKFATINAPFSEHPDQQATALALEEMQKSETSPDPTLIFLGLTACHTPIYNAKSIMDTIPKDPKLPPIPADDFNDIGPNGSKMADFGRADAQLCLADEELGTSYIRHYYGCIKTVDTIVGQLMDFVDKSQNEWFVIFTSDHGFHLLDKELMTKFTLWPQATQVPLTLYGKGMTGGKVVDMPVSLVDVYPTFVELLGVKATHQLKGVSLFKSLKTLQRKPAVVYYIDGKAVTTRRWHLIQYKKFDFDTRSYKAPSGEVELYHRIKDPWALNNLAAVKPNVVARLIKKEM